MHIVSMHISCLSYYSTVPSVHINVHSQLPTSAGLGSSAAFATCLVTSLLIGFDHISPPPQQQPADRDGDDVVQLTDGDLQLINRWSFMVEKIIHGRPSGIDNSVSTYGQNLTQNYYYYFIIIIIIIIIIKRDLF